MRAYVVTITALSPLVASGRGNDPNYAVGASEQEQQPVLTGSAVRGCVLEALRSVAHKESFHWLSDWIGTPENHATDLKLYFSDCLPKSGFSYAFRTRVALDRHTRTVQPGKLISLKAVAPNTEFVGKVFLDSTIQEERWKEVQDLLESIPLRIGGSQTSGYGRVQISFMPENDPENFHVEKGLYHILLKPHSPFATTKMGNETTEKRYFNESLPFLSASAFRSQVPVSRATPLYPSDKGLTVAVPRTFFQKKYDEEGKTLNLLKELLFMSGKGVPSLAQTPQKNGIASDRLEIASGYMNSKTFLAVSNSPVFSTHVQRCPQTRTVKAFWVQQSYKPAYLSALIHAEDSLSIPKYLVLGGLRGKGYGQVEVESVQPYREWDGWEAKIQSLTKFMEQYALGSSPDQWFIPLLINSPWVPSDSESPVEGCELTPFRFTSPVQIRWYEPSLDDPNSGVTKVVTGCAAGSVLILQSPKTQSLDQIISMLKEAKVKGLGKYAHLGCGDFEIYPMEEV